MNAVTGTAPGVARLVRRGLSLVELMIGVTIGLFVVAAATVMVSGQLGENRRLLVETQLQQDMRATADIITRELRRIGAVRLADLTVSTATVKSKQQQKPYETSAPASGAVLSTLEFQYEREAGAVGPWGFKLEGGVIKSRQTGGNYQDLTDPAVMVVDTFTITVERVAGQQLPCPTLCPGTGDTACWPQLHVQHFIVYIEAHSRANLGVPVRRSVTSRVRARNDWVEFKSGDVFTACPS